MEKPVCGVLMAVLACLALRVAARPEGAPVSVCQSMIPGHSSGPQSSPAPFTITTDSTTIAGNQQITVTISPTTSGQTFAGFMLQARRADPGLDTTTALGTFTAVARTQRRNCGSGTNNMLTHTDAYGTPFNNLVVTWTAPAASPGHIQFVATVAESFSVYWLEVKSDIIRDPNAPEITTAATTTPSFVVDDSMIDVTGCGSTKGCFRSPPGCTDKCELLVTWADGTNAADIEISRKGEGWVALGLSDDKNMGTDSVMGCLRSPTMGLMTVSHSYNNGRNNEGLGSDAKIGISNIRVGLTDGYQICRFSRNKTIVGNTDKIFNLDKAYYFLLGRGKAVDTSSGILINKHDSTPFISDEPVSISQNVDVGGFPRLSSLVAAHGAMMIIAWVMTCSFGILMPRHYKRQWPGKQLFGKDVWFPLHVMAMVTTFLITAIAFILIFVHVKGYSSLTEVTPSILRAHPVLGIIVMCLALINPVMGALRPGLDSAYRYLFNWGHWGVGTTACILAVVNIFLGLSLPIVKDATPSWLVYVMIGFVAFAVLFIIILEVQKCLTSNSGTTRSSTLELKSPGDADVTVSQPSPVPGGVRLRRVVLLIVIAGLICFGLALVIGVGMSA